MPFPTETPQLTSDLASWLPEALLWVALAALIVLVVTAVGVWTLISRLSVLAGDTRRLGILERIAEDLGRVTHEREDLDLHRIEHVLVDIRTAQVRLEEALLRTLEAQAAGSERDLLAPQAAPESLAERVVNRLLSLGFGQIQLVTPVEEIQALNSEDGEVIVEVKRAGVLHKGRVLVRGGRLAEVEVQPSYAIFP